jgi:hypothetical protein
MSKINLHAIFADERLSQYDVDIIQKILDPSKMEDVDARELLVRAYLLLSNLTKKNLYNCQWCTGCPGSPNGIQEKCSSNCPHAEGCEAAEILSDFNK